MIATLKRFFKFCSKENRNLFYRSIFLGFILALCEGMKFVATGIVLQGFFKGTPSNFILIGFLVLAASLILGTIVRSVSMMHQTTAGYRECADKRIEIAEHLRYLPMGYFNKNSLGEIISVATNTMENLGDIATKIVLITTQGLLNTAVFTILVTIFDWRIGLIMLAGILIFTFINHLKQKKNSKIVEEKIKLDTALIEKVLEYVQGIAEIKAYHISGDKRKDLNQTLDDVAAKTTELEMAVNKFIPFQTITLKLTGVMIMLASIYFYLYSGMEIANTIVMIILSFHIFTELENTGAYSSLLRLVDISVIKAGNILNLEAMDISGKTIHPEKKDIELKQVDFSYAKKKILDGVSLVIPEKSTAAFVGPSGAGKTTVCKLMARFWDVNDGEVTLGGTDVKEYSMDSLMENFSFVFQNVFLFNDTIANNIRFGKPDASIEEVIEAAKKAQCHEFISKLSNGYDTVIGEKGSSLSGGERQRISIARAIMKDSPIIILDEATANIDPENEKELMDAISNLTKEKTVIMIAHRLKTVQHADTIFVVDKGKIVDSGTHAELLQRDGIYKNFIRSREEAVSWKIS